MQKFFNFYFYLFLTFSKKKCLHMFFGGMDALALLYFAKV